MANTNIAPRIFKLESTIDELIAKGEIPHTFKSSKEYKNLFAKEAIKDNLISVDSAIQKGHITEDEALKDGFIKINDSKGGDFGIRSKASLADTEQGKSTYLEGVYGKGNVKQHNGETIVKNKGSWEQFDSNKIELSDFADMAGEVPEIAGATAGGIGGFILGGPLGATAGAGAGGAGGRGLKKVIANLIGVKDNQSNSQIVSDIGNSGALSMAGEVGGLAIGKLLGKVLSPNAAKYGAKEQGIEELARKVGIKLTPADTMGGSLTQIENALGYSLGGGKITNLKHSQFNTLKDYLTSAITSKTGGRSSTEIGESLQKSMGRGVNDAKSSFNSRYDSLVSQIDNGTIPLTESSAIAKKLLLESQHDVLKPFIDGKTVSQLEAISGAVKNNGTITGYASPVVDYPTFKVLRTSVNDLGSSNNIVGNMQNGKFKQVSKGLNTDFNTFANANGLGGVKSAIDDGYKIFKEDIAQPEIRRVLGTPTKVPIDPEHVVDTVLTPRGVSRIDRVEKYGASRNDLEGGLLNRYMDKATSRTANGDEFISPNRLDTVRGRHSGVEGNVLSPDSVDSLNTFTQLNRAVGASNPSVINPSGTAKASGGLFDLASSIPRYLGTQAYTTDTAYKLLTKGLLDEQQRKVLSTGLGSVGANINSLSSRPSK